MRYMITLVNGETLGPTAEGVTVEEQNDGSLVVRQETRTGKWRSDVVVSELTVAAGQWCTYGSADAFAALFEAQQDQPRSTGA